MQLNRKLVAAPALGAAAAAVAVASAFGASSAAPKVDHIGIKAGAQIKPGFWIKDNLRYTPYVSTVKSGGTVVIKAGRGAFGEGPHTFSIVRKSDLPRTAAQANACKACGKIAEEHGVDPSADSSQPPAHPFVDGGDGFNKRYDSVVFEKNPAPIKITAKKGKTLYFMCAVHPWMQGKIIVK